MRGSALFGAACIVVASGVLAVSCKTSETGTVPSDKDSAAIYAAVTRQLATVDDTFGGHLNPPTLYIVRNTDDRAGNPGEQQPNSALISSAVQAGITADLGDSRLTLCGSIGSKR